jgi:hypothetical protein
MSLNLSTLAMLLGLGVSVPNFLGLLNPKAFASTAQKFSRSTVPGYILVLLGTVWFVYNVKVEPIADFESLKPTLFTLFAAVGIGTCIFVQDFIAVRGFAVVLLLLAKLMVDTARWHPSEWRLVIVVWAYVLVFLGMWFTISPWRMRDLLNWATADEKRVRVGSAVRLAFGVFVFVLGMTAFRAS